MNISGVLVHAKPEQIAQVKQQLQNISGVEIHASTETGHLIVTIEQDNETMMADTVLNIQNHEGVLSAVVVYQYGDNDDVELENLI